MICPDCGGKLTTPETRSGRGNARIRTKKCSECGGIFRTIEKFMDEETYLSLYRELEKLRGVLNGNTRTRPRRNDRDNDIRDTKRSKNNTSYW